MPEGKWGLNRARQPGRARRHRGVAGKTHRRDCCPSAGRALIPSAACAATALSRLRRSVGRPALRDEPRVEGRVADQHLTAPCSAAPERPRTPSSSPGRRSRPRAPSARWRPSARGSLGCAWKTARNLPNCIIWLTWNRLCSSAPATGVETPVRRAERPADLLRRQHAQLALELDELGDLLAAFLQLVGEPDAERQLALQRVAGLDAERSAGASHQARPGRRLWRAPGSFGGSLSPAAMVRCLMAGRPSRGRRGS